MVMLCVFIEGTPLVFMIKLLLILVCDSDVGPYIIYMKVI
jgi:hypothetical protein